MRGNVRPPLQEPSLSEVVTAPPVTDETVFEYQPMLMSVLFMPHAATSMSTSSSAGTGTGTSSRYSSLSRPP